MPTLQEAVLSGASAVEDSEQGVPSPKPCSVCKVPASCQRECSGNNHCKECILKRHANARKLPEHPNGYYKYGPIPWKKKGKTFLCYNTTNGKWTKMEPSPSMMKGMKFICQKQAELTEDF